MRIKKAQKKTGSTKTAAPKRARAVSRTPAQSARKKQTAGGSRRVPALSPGELRSIGREIAGRFPQTIDDDRLQLVLLDVDPHMMHAYWNIPLPRYAAAAGASGDAAKRLRIYLLPADDASVHAAVSWFDIETQGLRNQQYIDLTRDNAPYAAQFGIIGNDGRFVSLVTSNSVRTPPAGRSLEQPPAVPEQHARRPVPAMPAIEPSYGAEPAEDEKLDRHTGGRTPHTEFQPPRPEVLLDEQYIDGLVQHRMQLDTARLLDPATPHPAPRAVPPPGSVSSLSLLRQAAGATGLCAELVIEGRIRPGIQLVLHGSEVPVGMDGSFKIRQQLPVDERLVHLLRGIAGAAPPAAAEHPVLLLQTPGFEHDRLQLEVYASLHVYGNAVDRDMLTLFGSETAVRPDGSFHITRALPRGACILPELIVAAQSPEGIR